MLYIADASGHIIIVIARFWLINSFVCTFIFYRHYQSFQSLFLIGSLFLLVSNSIADWIYFNRLQNTSALKLNDFLFEKHLIESTIILNFKFKQFKPFICLNINSSRTRLFTFAIFRQAFSNKVRHYSICLPYTSSRQKLRSHAKYADIYCRSMGSKLGNALFPLVSKHHIVVQFIFFFPKMYQPVQKKYYYSPRKTKAYWIS